MTYEKAGEHQMQREKCELTFAVTGHIIQTVELRAGVTTQQLREGLERGIYRTTMNGTEIIDTISKRWVAKISTSGPAGDFAWNLERLRTRDEAIAEIQQRRAAEREAEAS